MVLPVVEVLVSLCILRPSVNEVSLPVALLADNELGKKDVLGDE